MLRHKDTLLFLIPVVLLVTTLYSETMDSYLCVLSIKYFNTMIEDVYYTVNQKLIFLQ